MRLVFLTLLFLVACDQSPPPINESFGGELSADSPKLDDGTSYARHAFRGYEGKRVDIVLVAEDFQGFVALFNSQSVQLASESQQGGEARINWLLPGDDVYTIVVNTESETYGSYRVTVRSEDVPVPPG